MNTIYIDFSNKSIIPILHFKQNDRYSRFFNVVLIDNGSAYTLPSGASFKIRYKAPSGVGWYDAITESDGTTTHSAFTVNANTITCEIASAMLTEVGNGILDLEYYLADGTKLSTWNINFDVEKIPCNDEDIASTDYWEGVTNDIAEIVGAAAEVTALTTQIADNTASINNLANSVSGINTNLGNYTKISTGSGTTTNINGYFRSVKLNFDKPFQFTPIVIPSILWTDGNTALETRLTIAVVSRTATGCTIRVGDANNGIASKNIVVGYIAIGV